MLDDQSFTGQLVYRMVSDWPAMTSSSLTSRPNLHALLSDWLGAGAGTWDPAELKVATKPGRWQFELDGRLLLVEECGGMPLKSW